MPDVYPISWCGHSAADACLPVQTHEVGTAAPAAAPSPPTQTGDILLPTVDPCLPVQTAEVGTAAPAAAPSPPTQAGDILLTATDPFLVQTAEGLLAAQIEADNEITVEYEGMPMLVKVQHVYSVDEVEETSSLVAVEGLLAKQDMSKEIIRSNLANNSLVDDWHINTEHESECTNDAHPTLTSVVDGELEIPLSGSLTNGSVNVTVV